MDTLYDPFGDGTRISDFPACETIADIEMIDNDCSMFFTRGVGSSQNVGMTSGSSDSSLISLLKTQDFCVMNGNQTSNLAGAVGAFSTNQAPPPQQQQLAASNGGNKYVAVPVHSSLTMDQQRSPSVVNVSRSSGLCSTVSSLHQHMADMNDMSATAGDASDFVLRYAAKSNTQLNTKSDEAFIQHPTASRVVHPMQNSALLGSVFSQCGAISSLRTCEPKALGRIKGGVVATSCGTLLRHSVSIPNAMNTASVQSSASKANGKSMLDSKVRNGTLSSTRTNNNDPAIPSCDMRGGRATSAYPGLDDHRYTLKQVPPNHNVSKLRKSGGAHASNPSFCGQDGNMRMAGDTTSILEAFLRSTRPMDPNKGSNAALAAEGLSYLRLDERQSREKPDSSGGLGGNGGCATGMLLKKLLTGEIDQGQALRGQTVDQRHEREHQRMIQDRLLCPSLPIDSPLTDGFGLDVDLTLDDSQIMGMGLMGADIPDITESIWLGDLSDELVCHA